MEAMKKRSWTELVVAGRNAQWRLGDLALEIVPMVGNGGAPGVRGAADKGVHARLEKYAKTLGTSYRSLVYYRQIANAWPLDKRVAGVHFSVHALLAPEPGRVGMMGKLAAQAKKQKRAVSADDARVARGKKPQRLTAVQDGVPVSQHERRAPGTVTPIRRKAVTRDELRELLERLSDNRIGELIEEAWKILEARAAKVA